MTKEFVAAVDMGTNSFHLVIAEIKEDGSFNIIDKEREVIRLGSQQGQNLNHISDDEINRAVKILKRFRKLADEYNTELHAVSTSAVREADNKKDFINIIKEKIDLNVEVIEGREEARLIYNGASKALSLNNKKALCIDIGGGSTEFIFADNSKIVFAESIKIGAVRLSKKFFPDYYLTDERINYCSNYIEEMIRENSNIILDAGFEIAVGSSGTIQSAAGMISVSRADAELKDLNGYEFIANELNILCKLVLSKKTSAERIRIKGLEKKRTDIIPAGLLILQKSFEIFNIDKMMISEYALREGIILESLQKKFKNSSLP